MRKPFGLAENNILYQGTYQAKAAIRQGSKVLVVRGPEYADPGRVYNGLTIHSRMRID